MSGTVNKSATARRAGKKSSQSAAKTAPLKSVKTVSRTAAVPKPARQQPIKSKSKKTAPKKESATRASKAQAKTKRAAPIKAVHSIQELHAPVAPRVKVPANVKINEAWMWVAFFLTFLFVYSVAENVLDSQKGLIGSPNTYAGIPAFALALVVWRANRTKSTYTGMVIVISILLSAGFVWLFGVTSASKLLFG